MVSPDSYQSALNLSHASDIDADRPVDCSDECLDQQPLSPMRGREIGRERGVDKERFHNGFYPEFEISNITGPPFPRGLPYANIRK